MRRGDVGAGGVAGVEVADGRDAGVRRRKHLASGAVAIALPELQGQVVEAVQEPPETKVHSAPCQRPARTNVTRC